ncbi:DNA-binding domain-containing protein [Laceyella tengchongensis]|jgi:two-component system, response regulator YcbB|uniref:DNA-binding domain-containing protein n=1 Tax=Laceyella tengchongensis TaxID=574699 RepID=UPI0003B4EFBE|nr:response regulator [Laceyella tengchongensis]
MRIYIVDDDEAVRLMLTDLIEDYDLGEVVGEADDGKAISTELMINKRVDVLIIDYIMSGRDGLETVERLNADGFDGKIVMISQDHHIESISLTKDEIYYHFEKPLNRLKVQRVLKNIKRELEYENKLKSIYQIMSPSQPPVPQSASSAVERLQRAGKTILTELGIWDESGRADLMEALLTLHEREQSDPGHELPQLKEICQAPVMKRMGTQVTEEELRKLEKSVRQRMRRAIRVAFGNLAATAVHQGYAHEHVVRYSGFFGGAELSKMVQHMRQNQEYHVRLDTRKFLIAFYELAKEDSQ